MEKKEEKKGFWASLFAPKQSSCCGAVIEEVAEEPTKDEQNVEEESKPEENDKPKCSCGGNC